MNFRVGQRVVCIRDNNCPPGSVPRRTDGNYPNQGGIYTIRQINNWGKVTLVLLHEIDNAHLLPLVGGAVEPGFNIRHFRPVVERKTDISIFKRMLTPSKVSA